MREPQRKVTTQDREERAPKPGQASFEDIHRVLFPEPPKPRTLAELKEGVTRHLREKYSHR